MLNKKEIIIISIIVIILSGIISMFETLESFFYIFLSIIIIFTLNIFTKKITSNYFDSEIEIKLWEIKRYGFKPHKKLKRSFPIGAFLPIIFAFFTFGYVKFMGSLVFDIKAKVSRAAKKHGLYIFSEMTEDHIGLIAAAGITINLIAAVIGYLIEQPEFARLSIWFAFSNMLPISDLDGNKIFFGNKILWVFLAAITLVGAGYALLLI